MSELSPAQAAELRGEIAELRRRIDELEQRLERRADAGEMKQHNDHLAHAERLAAHDRQLGALERSLHNLESVQRANLLAIVHLQGVTAMAVGVPREEWLKQMHAVLPPAAVR